MGNSLVIGIWSDVTILFHNQLLLKEQQCKIRKKRKRNPNRRHNFHYILEEIDLLTDLEFQKMFRMKIDSFEKLYDTSEPLLFAPNEPMAQRSSGSTVSKKTKPTAP